MKNREAPLQKAAHEGQILSLIDLALLTKDKAWFIELTAELKDYKIKARLTFLIRNEGPAFLLFIGEKQEWKAACEKK
ncbi:IDEAL domain-containing protein [Priestia megaterium]